MKCPICYAKLIETIDRLDGLGPTLEETQRCPKHHYSYEYLYGSTLITVGKVTVHGSYNDSLEQADQNDSDLQKLIADFKRNQKMKRIGLSILAAVIIPGGFILVPLYWYREKKKAQENLEPNKDSGL